MDVLLWKYIKWKALFIANPSQESDGSGSTTYGEFMLESKGGANQFKIGLHYSKLSRIASITFVIGVGVKVLRCIRHGSSVQDFTKH